MTAAFIFLILLVPAMHAGAALSRWVRREITDPWMTASDRELWEEVRW